MKAILFLLVIIFIYYQIYYRIPYFIPYTYHIYFWISVGIYLLIYYILTYQRPFAVQMMTNMNDASNKPLYDFNNLKVICACLGAAATPFMAIA